MPSDYITINALTKELNSILSLGKIDKVVMPEKDEVVLAIRANNQTYALAISCNASNPRMHITHQKKLNPLVAPAFCMHLRKHLVNGNITSIHTINEDRIISIDVLTKNEMRDEVTYKLIIEMMGRYSNIIVVNQNDTITDALKQVPFDVMTKRTLVPGAKYLVPEQTKITLSNTETIETLLRNYIGTSISQMLSNNISGIAKSTAIEIVEFAGIEDSKQNLSDEDIKSLIKALNIFENIYNTKYYAPCTSITNDISQDYYVCKYKDITEYKSFKTLNEAIEDCLAKKDEVFRQQERTKYLTKAYNSYLSKCKKKLEKVTQRFSEAQTKETYRIYGELIISNIYKINKGDTKATVTNYYDENQADVTIKLDETLSPQQNAQAYFKKYNKLKHSEEVSIEQMEELENDIEYLKSIEPYILMAKTPQEILDVQKELESIGALKSTTQKKGAKKEKETPPLTYLCDDFVILVGKNNLQNDKITFKIANGGDMWLHTKTFHGSHTVIITEGREIPNNVLQTACEICAAYSNCGDETKVEVDYTFRKNVKRHPNKKPGMVLYEVYQTAVVSPNKHENLLQK